MHAAVNPVDVAEAAYDLDADDRAWLDRLTTLVRPLLDEGLGTIGYMFDVRIPAERWAERTVIKDIDPSLLQVLAEIRRGSPGVVKDFHLQVDSLTSMSEQLARPELEKPEKLDVLNAIAGARDAVAFQTVEPDGCGVLFSSMRREVTTFDRRTKRLWRRIAAHIAAGRRLRASLSDGGGAIEAVMTPSGRVDHAEGLGTSVAAREALRAAVMRQERVRGKERHHDPAAATEAWTALVSGRWSLVDQFERGGRRYIVARRNDLGLADPRALTAREHAIARLAALGKASKLIAYELGLSESTVGTHLASAMRKLGARTRVELVGLVAQLDAALRDA